MRGEAAGALAGRDTSDAIECLIGSLHDPLRIDRQDVPGAVGVLKWRTRRRSSARPTCSGWSGRRTCRTSGARLSPLALPPLTGRNGPTALQKLDHDVAAARKVNARREAINERVGGVLAMVTSQDFGANPDSWRQWWSEEQGVPDYRT